MQKYCRKCNKELDSLLPFHCKYCNDYFCEEHRLPENHNCKNVKTSWDSWKKRQRKLQDIPEERHSSQRIPIHNTSKVDYVKPRNDNLMGRRYSSDNKNQDKPYFVPSDNRSMSFEKPLPKTERLTRNEKPRPNYFFSLKNSFRNIRWTNKQILLVFILATVITNIIGMALLKGEIFGFPKSNCALISLCGIFVTVLGIISSVQSNRAYMNWDRSEARHVRQWTKGVQREEEYHNFNMSMTGILMAIGMSLMILPIIVLFETIVGTVLFILNLIYAVGILILIRKVFRRR